MGEPRFSGLTESSNRFAGSDTTATSIRAILLHIVTNPLIYNRLRLEIDTHIANGTLSSPAREEQVRNLPYLQACIREGLRIFPPITYLRERVTPPAGDTLSGFDIPGGVNIGFNLPGLLLNRVFNPDPTVFRPERWLDGVEPGHLREMERVMELVFGWGSTRCLGIRMANTNQSKFFVEVSSTTWLLSRTSYSSVFTNWYLIGKLSNACGWFAGGRYLDVGTSL